MSDIEKLAYDLNAKRDYVNTCMKGEESLIVHFKHYNGGVVARVKQRIEYVHSLPNDWNETFPYLWLSDSYNSKFAAY